NSIYYKEGDFIKKDDLILTIQKKTSGGVIYNPYEVRSIYEGLIVKNGLVEGEEVFEKSEIINIADISKYKLKLYVSDKDIPYMKVGNSCFVKENKSISGTVTKVGIIPDSKTGLFEVELNFFRNKELFIGKYITVEIRANFNKSITINFNEVVNKYGKTFLYIVEDDIVNLREIKLGKNWGDRVTIESGVKPGEKYVTYSSRTLNDKDKIIIQKEKKEEQKGKK
ncbi:MAG TPA: HlyD family efflux transporter periplasmic adaptor subunit, partial [Spirochaetota bacterium]|nr:HlyD family efflux transporter periplasmic adaptor subunit [Spirochaetota bacterium]